MVTGNKVKLAMGFHKSPPHSSFFFPRSSSQVQPSPPDATQLLRLVEELRDRESRLKTELLQHKLLKQTAAIVPLLENDIVARDTLIQTNANKIQELEAENERLRNELHQMEVDKTESQRKMKALEDDLAELKKTASFQNDEVSSSQRLQGLVEVSVKSNLIKNLKKMVSDHATRNHNQFQYTVMDFKPEVAVTETRCDSEQPAESTDSVLASVVTTRAPPRLPKPAPTPPSSGSSYSVAAAPENTVETEQLMKLARPPPPPPPPMKGSRAASAKVMRVPEVVEFYHSLMRRESHSRRDSNSVITEVPATANARDMIGEIENRSSHLLAIKTDVETKGDFIRCLIKEVEGAAFTDIEDVVLFVKRLDDELSHLVDERAVLKHFDWPEQKADALREAAFAYCDLKKLESEAASSFRGDPQQPCGPALKKMRALLEKLEHGVYNISRMRESATNRYKVFQIPVQWMLDNGFASQLKLASVKLARKYMRRISAELEIVGGGPEEEELIVQGVRFAFRVHQFAGGFDVETMRAFQELREKARLCHVQCHSQQQKFLCRSATC